MNYGGQGEDKPKRHRIRLVFADVIVTILLVLAASMIAAIQLDTYDIASRNYPQTQYIDIENPLYKPENMTLYVDMSARTFSAHEKISVEVSLFQNLNQRARDQFYLDESFQNINWSEAIYRIRFDNTYCPTDRGTLIQCFFDLYWNPELFRYTSDKQEIRYSLSGIHRVYLFNQTTNEDQFRVGNLTSASDPFIQIESIATINSLEQAEAAFNTQKSVATIAIVAVVIAGLSFYQRIRRTLLHRFGEYRL